ncbi:PREDICTED: uncharacterized protein LOC105960397 [Erythranthe guttata]|uniref:uncharacterized protein LOC105960397 n=1 Tax=Erythranthe guttata TaxID=4155 RepID=UPI00064DCEA5|nr:PREDICTED: uncharacterized protein LOC105960397 [Erythranthe guttata]|eukprot:XP_012840015.1 PREDICTED: uncharacterized protein LOC105960397 [Erythranthe guttata]
MGSRKRKTLSDLTNTYNLIPTSILRKLVAATATAASDSNSFSKPLISAFNSNSNSANQKSRPESSNRSDSSIGSSNISVTGNSRTVQFRTPPPAVSSVTSLGGVGSKDVAHNKRQITEKSKKRKEVDLTIISSPTSVEKRKNKGKAIAVPFNSSLPQKLESNQNEDKNRASLLKRKKHKVDPNLSLCGAPVDMMKDSDKGIFGSYDGTYGKTAKGKGMLKSSVCGLGKQSGMLEGDLSCSIEKTYDRKKGILKGSGSSTLKIKDVEKEFVSPSSFLVERTKAKGKPLNPFNYSYEKAKEKGKAILETSDIVAGTIVCHPPRKRTEKWKNDPGASSSSCPPKTRTNNIQDDIYGAGNFKFSEPWTDPLPKYRKKRCSEIESSSELPLDFIEQPRAHLQEVDEEIICLAPKTRSEKWKNDLAASSSCSPMTRTKNIQNDIDEAGKFKSLKSWTDPLPKCRKKRGSEIKSELPIDFIEQQKAYYKEVDDFELPEEEVSSQDAPLV